MDPETLDYIIVAQNIGDVMPDNIRADMVPTLAARVKHKLRIAILTQSPSTSPSVAPAGSRQ